MRVFQPIQNGKPLCWYVEFTDTTRTPIRKRQSLRTHDPDTAKSRAEELERKWSQGEYDPWTGHRIEKGMRLKEAIDVVCEQRYSRLAEGTYRQRRYLLTNLFGKSVGLDKEIRTITAHHVRTFLAKYEGHTYNTFYGQLRTFFNDLERLQAIKHNPFNQIAKPRARYPVNLRVVEDFEYEAMVQGMTNPWLVMTIHIAYYTGMRHGEVRNLRWDNIRFEDRLIDIKNTEGFKTKNRLDRTVPIPEALATLLTEWKERYLDHIWDEYRRADQKDWVILNRKGEVPNCHSTVITFRKNMEQLGLSPELTLHKYRHTFASKCVRAGMPIEVLKEILGHASINTTLIYAHFQTQDLSHWVSRIFDK